MSLATRIGNTLLKEVKLIASVPKEYSRANYSHKYKLVWSFDSQRTKTYGLTNRSWHGRGYSEDLNHMILYNMQACHSNPFDKIEMHYTEKPFYLQPDFPGDEKSLTSSWHTFLKCYKGSKETIIDPSYKSLYMIHRGHVDKWNSPYANKIFDLPPVFVGSKKELDALNKDMSCARVEDPLHKDDDIVDWHKDTKVIWVFTQKH